MGAMTSPITSLTIVYLTVYSSADQSNIKAPRHWPLCGELPAQRASHAMTICHLSIQNYISMHMYNLKPEHSIHNTVTIPALIDMHLYFSWKNLYMSRRKISKWHIRGLTWVCATDVRTTWRKLRNATRSTKYLILHVYYAFSGSIWCA